MQNLKALYPLALTDGHPEHESDERDDGELEHEVQVDADGHCGHPGQARRQERHRTPVLGDRGSGMLAFCLSGVLDHNIFSIVCLETLK